MRYAYHDLGPRLKGSTATVHWSGAAADVLLLDPVNFTKYRERRLPVMYQAGGHYRGSPAVLTIPADGRWYVVADLRGYSSFSGPAIEVRDPQSEQPTRQENLTEVA